MDFFESITGFPSLSTNFLSHFHVFWIFFSLFLCRKSTLTPERSHNFNVSDYFSSTWETEKNWKRRIWACVTNRPETKEWKKVQGKALLITSGVISIDFVIDFQTLTWLIREPKSKVCGRQKVVIEKVFTVGFSVTWKQTKHRLCWTDADGLPTWTWRSAEIFNDDSKRRIQTPRLSVSATP